MTEGTGIKMRISFDGIESNALRGLRELEELAQKHEDFEEHDNCSGWAKACISAYRDTILALCKGDVDVETAKDFWFHGDDLSKIPYRNDIIKFTEESEAA